MKRRFVLAGLPAVAFTALFVPGRASAYPERPVQLVVPYPPGGATDLLGRLVARRMAELLGKPVVVENRAGAAGAVGTAAVARSRPDGHTLLVGTAAQAVRMAFPQPGFDFRADFVPLAFIGSVPNVILAHPGFPGTSLAELVDMARRTPGELRVGSTGVGGSAHLGLELLQSMTGIRTVHVPYKGSAPGIADVLAGHIPLMIDALSTAVPLVRSGKLRALGITGRTRSQLLPDVPAIAELVPGFEAEGWYGIFGVAATPAPVVTTLQTMLEQVVSEPAFLQKAAELGAAPRSLPPDRFREFVDGEVDKWTRIVAERRIVLE